MSQEVANQPEVEENFGDMLDRYEEKEKEVNEIIDGEIVQINEAENRVMIDTKSKIEPFISIDEIRGEDGEIKYSTGETIKVVVTSVKGGNYRVSHKKYLELQKTGEYIAEHGENYEDIVINGSIIRTSKKGYTIEENGVVFFMPHSQAFLLKKGERVENRRLQEDKKVRAKIIKVDAEKSLIIISRKRHIQSEIKKRQEFIAEVLEKDLMQCRVIAVAKDKLIVDVENRMKGYIASDEISHKGNVNPFRLFKSKDIVEAKATGYDEKERVFNLSIKATTTDPWIEIQNEIDRGDVIEVTVSNIEHYGAFVDIGNDAEGFLHISEISWDKKINDPKEYLTVGDVIEVEVIEIDPEAHRLRVSRKALLQRPFEVFRNEYREGDIVKGEITNITDFGAFIKIGQVEGLLRNQDLNWKQNSKCKDELQSGEEIEVKVSQIDYDREKISLNRKALLDTPTKIFSKTNKVGDIVTGVVRDVKEFGVFVTLQGEVDALIRKEDISPLNIDEIEKSQEIEAMIIALDSKRDRVRLSVRRLERAKEQQLLKQINAENGGTSNTLGDLLGEKLSK
jgi:small subunit ribosomal protein S1